MAFITLFKLLILFKFLISVCCIDIKDSYTLLLCCQVQKEPNTTDTLPWLGIDIDKILSIPMPLPFLPSDSSPIPLSIPNQFSV